MSIKIKYWLIVVCIGIAVIMATPVKAQCDDKLVDKAIAKSGNDALFIREFVLKASYKGKKMKVITPAFTSKYDIRLNKGIVYRFIVENEDDNIAQAFLQLRKSNIMLASTYDVENQTNIRNFDYLCNESGEYQVIMSFVGENTGCAAGAMFAIMQDSLTLASIIDSTEIKNVLYAGLDNYIDIAASDIPGGSLDVSVSRGKITEESGLYKIRVEEPGQLTVNVVAKDKNGKITETFKSDFMVVAPMLPTITLSRNTGGLIKKSELLNTVPMLEIHNFRNDLQFKIKSFELTTRLTMQGVSVENDNKLNYRQLNIIKDLNPGDTFYISNIKIEDSKGKIYELEALGFIISE
jgi:hypothetical protein